MRTNFCHAFLVLVILIGGLATQVHAQLVFVADVKEVHPDLAAKEVTAEFAFINMGSAPVTIKAITPSCGCTVADSDKMTYKPGEKGTIKAVYSIHDSTGYQEKDIAITTVEDPNSVKVLTIKAYIPSLLTFTPNELRWTVGDKPISKTVSISVISNKSIKVIGVDCTTDQVIEKLHTLKENESYTVSVTPVSTDQPVTGIVIVKLLLPNETIPKLAFYHFSIVPVKRVTAL